MEKNVLKMLQEKNQKSKTVLVQRSLLKTAIAKNKKKGSAELIDKDTVAAKKKRTTVHSRAGNVSVSVFGSADIKSG